MHLYYILYWCVSYLSSLVYLKYIYLLIGDHTFYISSTYIFLALKDMKKDVKIYSWQEKCQLKLHWDTISPLSDWQNSKTLTSVSRSCENTHSYIAHDNKNGTTPTE